MRDRFSSAFTSDKKYGVYVHIPFCKAKCAYCAFVSSPDMSRRKDYVDALVREIKTIPASGALVDTVYIGGGTPSCLSRSEISSIFAALFGAFNVVSNAEITIEANPESCDDQFVRACVDCGVNRVSIGLQSSDDRVLKRIGRVHCFGDFITAVDRLRSRGVVNVSSDIILGLPEQTFEDIDRSVNVFAEYCSHASVYALTVEKGTPLYKSKYRPQDDNVADLYDYAVKLLADCGFSRYEVSNFARNGMRSRHNQKYWHFEPYLAFGAAAHGFDGIRLRYAHTDNVNKYIDGAKLKYTELSDDDIYNEYIMLALRTERGIDLANFSSRFGCGIEDKTGESLAPLVKSGVILHDGNYLRISPDKMFVMNGIIEELMI